MINWGLSGQPLFRDLKMTLAIDVPPGPRPDEPRTLGSVTSRPGDFLDCSDREGSFIAYQAHLNRSIEAVKKRENLAYALLKSQTLMPVASYEMTMAMMPDTLCDMVGKAALTTMPAAEYCIAPAIEVFREASIAVGNITMPMEGGTKGGMVSLRVPNHMALDYQQAVINAITQWHI